MEDSCGQSPQSSNIFTLHSGQNFNRNLKFESIRNILRASKVWIRYYCIREGIW